MIELGFWLGVAVCATVALAISYWDGHRYQTFWRKFAFFLIASVVGFLLFPLLCGAWIVAAPHERDLILAAIHGKIWQIIAAVAVMAYFGAWRMRPIIDDIRRRSPQ